MGYRKEGAQEWEQEREEKGARVGERAMLLNGSRNAVRRGSDGGCGRRASVSVGECVHYT